MSQPPKKAPSLNDSLVEEARIERWETMYGPDSAQGRELGGAIGKNLARYRTERGLDVPALAARADLDASLVHELERGEMVPSLRAIWRLATALSLPFGALLLNVEQPALSGQEFRVQRATEGRRVVSARNDFRSRVLFREGDSRSPEVYELTLEPGCVEPADAHASGTFEHIVVVSGALVIEAGEHRTLLGPGDAIFFQADIDHSYENPSEQPTVAHLVMHQA